MSLLIAAAVLILIALIIKFWMGINPEEGFLGKGFMIIIAVFVIVGILMLFGVVPNFRWAATDIPGAALAAIPSGTTTDMQWVLGCPFPKPSI